MHAIKLSVLWSCSALVLTTGAFAQTATQSGTTTDPAATPPAVTAPVAPDATAPAAASVSCADQFKALDANGDGFLSEDESPRDYARTRIDQLTLEGTGITPEQFEALCSADHWATQIPEEGAPFDGANSFTEGQALDRAIAWGVTDVTALTKDDAGIWRGTGKRDGADVSVAIDYKGNVVTGPKS